jgi:hypothetical protein
MSENHDKQRIVEGYSGSEDSHCCRFAAGLDDIDKERLDVEFLRHGGGLGEREKRESLSADDVAEEFDHVIASIIFAKSKSPMNHR